MATVAAPDNASHARDPLAPNWYEKLLAGAAIVLLVAVAIALVRGRARWDEMPPLVWVHIGTVLAALAITPVQLLRRRGDPLHRLLGWLWAVPLFATAMLSFWIRDLNQGGFSFIHTFSVITVVSVPLLVIAARSHLVAAHRRTVHGLVTGALLAAGYFTLLPTRLLGGWLFG